jgi:hypothetical protein
VAEFATLPDVKAHTNKTTAVDDGELTLMLDAAEDVVRPLVGSFAPVTVTERVAVTGGTVLLSRVPTGAVTLTDADGTAVTGFVTSAEARVLYDVSTWRSHLTASYPAGPGTVPAAVTLATAIIAAHLWETQRGTSPSALALQQPDADPGAVVVGAGHAIPDRAKELLESVLRQRRSYAA